MSIFEEVSENIVDLTKLGITTGVGYGVYKSGSLFELSDEQQKVTKLLSAGIIGYGLYNYAKSISPSEIPIDLAEPNSFPITVHKPYEGQDLSSLVPHIFKATISNPYDTEYTVYVGHSLYTPLGNVIDRPVKMITIPAKSSRTVSKTIYLELNMLGNWKVRYSVWNKFPTETTTDLVRIGDSGWINFELSWV